ncbi:opioid growth factor receptor-related protein [Endozoicomonas arenosclerae]|uniref:opioid growth factor receptor-related protein n=1 Tax=Endozoicomonas arenosclerae TaxID=1633495 RepID=UPI0007863959|nr:opioid growth factor receptor-related protein [Endozoicomonas arenosclerae]
MISTRVDDLSAQFKALDCWGTEKVGADVEDGPLKITAGNEQNYFAWGRTVVRVEEQERLYDELEHLINQMNMGARRRGLDTRQIEIHCFNPAELTRDVAEQVLAEIRESPRYTYDRIYHAMNQAYMNHSHTGHSEKIGKEIWAALEEVLEHLPEHHVKAVIPKVISSFFEDHRDNEVSDMIMRRIQSRYPDVSFGRGGSSQRQVTPPVRSAGTSATSGAGTRVAQDDFGPFVSSSSQTNPDRQREELFRRSSSSRTERGESSRTSSGATATSSMEWVSPPKITRVKNAVNRSESEELEMTDHWLAFSRTGKHKIAGQKHTLEGIRAFTLSQCESAHDYIQLLFPNSQPSQYNRTAPLLTDKMVMEIQSDRELQRELQKSLDQILDFWGMYRRGDQIFVDDSKSSRHKWNKAFYDHNESRVSRVLYHLMETGFVECALNMESAMNRHRGRRKNTHWATAVRTRPPSRRLSFNDI